MNPPKISSQLTAEQRRYKMTTLVEERMRATGLPYRDAWTQIEAENPDLVKAMKQSHTPGILSHTIH